MDVQRWRVTVRAGSDPETAAAQVLDPRGVTTLVLWGTPEPDDDDEIVMNVNLHTNVAGDRETVGWALALYLEAVLRTLREGVPDDVPVGTNFQPERTDSATPTA
jgi:hypothetical protein